MAIEMPARVRFDGKLISNGDVVSIKWSTHISHHLVSCNDMTVRLWDTNRFECISKLHCSNPVYCAVICPCDSNMMMIGGKSESLHVLDWRHCATTNANKKAPNGIVIEDKNIFRWATALAPVTKRKVSRNIERRWARERLRREEMEMKRMKGTTDPDTKKLVQSKFPAAASDMRSKTLSPISEIHSNGTEKNEEESLDETIPATLILVEFKICKLYFFLLNLLLLLPIRQNSQNFRQF